MCVVYLVAMLCSFALSLTRYPALPLSRSPALSLSLFLSISLSFTTHSFLYSHEPRNDKLDAPLACLPATLTPDTTLLLLLLNHHLSLAILKDMYLTSAKFKKKTEKKRHTGTLGTRALIEATVTRRVSSTFTSFVRL